MASAFGLWGDSLDHLFHLVVTFFLALPPAAIATSGKVRRRRFAARAPDATRSA